MRVRALISGSLAHDCIMGFPGKFRDTFPLLSGPDASGAVVIAEDMVRRRGGCGGNIAHSFAMLGGEPLLVATVGSDFGDYRDHLRKMGADDSCVLDIPDALTAQAHIVNDSDGVQLTVFHPGAMSRTHEQSSGAERGADIATISPSGKEGMMLHARECAAAGIPTVFDPGQGLGQFNKAELAEMMDLADFAIFNSGEFDEFLARAGGDRASWVRRVRAVVVTAGAAGSTLLTGGEEFSVPVVVLGDPVDPTGCGDAYRAGLLWGVASGWSLADSCHLGAVVAGVAVLHKGGQGHTFSPGDIRGHWRRALNREMPTEGAT